MVFTCLLEAALRAGQGEGQSESVLVPPDSPVGGHVVGVQKQQVLQRPPVLRPAGRGCQAKNLFKGSAVLTAPQKSFTQGLGGGRAAGIALALDLPSLRMRLASTLASGSPKGPSHRPNACGEPPPGYIQMHVKARLSSRNCPDSSWRTAEGSATSQGLGSPSAR